MSVFKSSGIGIAGVACAVPKNNVPVESFTSVFGEEVTSKFTSGTGIKATFKALPEQTASDLAVDAAQELFSHIDIDKSEIGAMFLVTQSPDYRRPSSASIVQLRLGLPIDCSCMEINLGCSGFVYGLQTAMAMMSASDYKYGLLLMGETATKLVDPLDKSIVMMYGDAGAAILLERKDGVETTSLLRSDGSRYKAIVLPAGGFRDMNPGHERFMCSDGIERSLYDIFMDGTSVFSFSISDVPQAITDYLRLTETTVADYNAFLFHQANQFIIKQLIRKMKLPNDQVPLSLDRYGNTGGISIPLTLCDAYGDKSGEKLKALICGFGIGLSWGVANIEVDTDKIYPIVQTEDYYKEGKLIPGQY
ncbi:3-oxoacyl-ACP synthase III family protein [Oribacterium sp. WCC10]|uniref:3-oxoacyl-ACP synthase III family protein n=1 Tax=Oribacterium sp. WCC10 TaxID=1855343 RepID=UPI0008DF3A7F|nr:ketoacyl-ACP synthase III [Oribacterium sp. WCC10]SFG65136.1 3-oxoacyl-[acyl-carrier-protein] synthase-3 [Oribacterium sp. WCC10]